MRNWLRLAMLGPAAFAAALPLAPATAATVTAQAKAKVVKPLSLTALQDMDFGSLLLGNGTWSSETVSISQSGQVTCPADVVCSGPALPAQFNVAGSNNMVVTITAPNVTMVNQADSSKTLTLTPDAPATVTLTNSGPPGNNFSIGGSMPIDSTTAEGDYVGTLTVSVDYQ